MHTNSIDSLDIGHQLLTTNIAQPLDMSNKSALWFAVKVIANDPNTKLSMSMLKMTETSSDTGDSLGNTNDLSKISGLVYSPHAMGVIWNSNTPGSNDTVIADALTSANTLVNEIDYIGLQSMYYDYSPSFPYAFIDTYVQSFTNFVLTANCSVIDANEVTLASAQKILQTKGNTTAPILTITANADQNQVLVGTIMDAGSTIKMYHSPTLQPPTWSLTATMNFGDTLVRTNHNLGFFRAILE